MGFKPMSLKTNYIGHDAQYKRFKAAGQNGWDDDETWQAWKAEILALIASTDFPKSGKVLELGCGAGDVALLFAEKGYQVHGIDIAPSAIEWAREKALKAGLQVNFEAGDVTKLGRWEDDYFDIVIDGHCLHCIIGDDRAEMLKEAYRVLRPGGSFYVSSMCGEPKEPEVLKIYDPESRCTIHGGVAGRYYGRAEDILKEIEEIGFKIIRQEIEVGKGTEDNMILLVKK